jgi:signal transduction histidine kinase
MSALVEDLVVIARLDAGGAASHGAEPTSVRDEMVRSAARWSPAVPVEVAPGPDHVVDLRPEELARVLDKVLGNAARYAATVRLSVERSDDRVGPGSAWPSPAPPRGRGAATSPGRIALGRAADPVTGREPGDHFADGELRAQGRPSSR